MGRRMKRRRVVATVVTAALGLVTTTALSSSASADFHLTKIREIAGETAASNISYIELQMYAPGQNLVSGHSITFWDQDGQVLGIPQPVQSLMLTGPNPPSGQNQRTILIGDVGVVGRDFTLDLTPFLDAGAGMSLVPAGAACFESIPVDCVSWGTFTGAANLPDGTTPFGGALPLGAEALRRDISAGCSTLLEASDDTNNAGVDFTNVTPAPTPNSVTPAEVACAGPVTTPTIPTTPSKPVAKRQCKRKGKKASAAAKKKCKKKKRR